MMDIRRLVELDSDMPDYTSIVPVRRENLQAPVYRQICKLILQGDVQPGQSLTVATLAKALDVSPMPVRDALSRLTHAGVLTTVSGRTLGVPRLSMEELEELYQVRLEIESIALEWAVAHRTDAFEANLREILVDLIDAERRGDNKAFIASNHRFHEAIYQQSGSEILLGIIQTLWLRVSPYFHLLDAQGHLQMSNECHEAVIEAIAHGDAAAACRALVEDIERAHVTLVKMK